ncbi:MAG: HAMP domain-containing histidine kinase [Actinobacteria bacterium]|nr:MAG: HAMP domain-containing histidine kinase [Actinomycetota bacterium]
MARLGVGLRPRVLLAMVLTGAVTLGVAALALLGPLETRLRHDASSNVITAVLGAIPAFDDAVTPKRRIDPGAVGVIARALARRTGARVAVVDGAGNRVTDTDPEVIDPFDDARLALASGHTVHDYRFGRLRVATTVRIAGHRYALVLRKRLNEVASANRVVRDAFLVAAGVGLATALLLGVGLSSGLVRRVRKLRDSAQQMEELGLEAPAPVDHSRDEVGALARTFAAMQSRLRREEASRRSFVATASHELRTPLASLDGMLELLRDDISSQPVDIDDARKRVVQAQEQSLRLGHLAADLLDLSRLDAAIELRSEPVELAELGRAVVAEFDHRSVREDRPVQFDAPPEPVWATGDPGSIARIVRILLDNALRASPAGERVTIEVGAGEDGRATVAVSDRGPGVPERERELIFERFQRGETAIGQGFGLGLAIGRELATRMGGSLELAPSGPGARFVLHLAADEITSPIATP